MILYEVLNTVATHGVISGRDKDKQRPQRPQPPQPQPDQNQNQIKGGK